MKIVTRNINQLILRSISLTAVLSVLMLFVFLVFFGLHSLNDHVTQSSETDSKIIFHSLQTLMSKGSNSEQLHDYINQIKDFDENKTLIFQTQGFEKIDQPTIEQHGQTVEIKYPFRIQPNCIQCHATEQVGNQKAILIHQYPISSLVFSLYDVISLITAFSLTAFTIIFTVLFFTIRKQVVDPITQLTKSIQQINSHEELIDFKKSYSIQEIEAIHSAFNQLSLKLTENYSDLRQKASTDDLTGLMNRRQFEQIVQMEMQRALEQNHRMTLFVLDLNHFKEINDQYGHAVGDKVLIQFATILSNTLRKTDFIFRNGGDEFVILITDAEPKKNQLILEKLRKNLLCTPFSLDDHSEFEISCSIGFACFPTEAQELDELFQLADQRMYQQKQHYHQSQM